MTMYTRTFTMLGAGVATMVLLTQGCRSRVPNPRHCANNEGDEYCNREFGDGLTVLYCEQGTPGCQTPDGNYGCVAERPTDECYSPCGGRSSIEENRECVVLEDSSSGSSEGTETEESTGSSSESSSSTTGPMPCVSDEECSDADAPFCGVNGECGTCSDAPDPDAACAGVDPLLPLCVAGACVACTDGNPVVCEEQLLLCDGTTNTCVQCVEHGECPSGACELSVGRCFPSDLVVRVDGDEVAMPPELYATVADALAAVPGGMHGVIMVHELDGSAPYTESVTIDAGKTIALLAAAGEAPIIQGTAGNPGLTVEGAGTILYMDGLTVSLSGGLGLRVNDAFAWVDRSRIVQNTGGGILAETGAELTLRNCFVGGSVDDANALEVNAATATVLYATLAAGTTTTVGLACTAPISVDVRNSLIVSRGIEATGGFDVVCDDAEITFSATEAVFDGIGNQAVGEMPNTMPELWFMGYGTGNFHLQNDGLTLFADVAQWTPGDPSIDIDGDPRPAVDGTPDYAGADVPQ